MAGGSAQGDGSGSTQPEPAGGVEFFIAPIQVNHRRYEALQAFLVGRPDPRPSRRQVQIDPVGDGQPQTPLRIRLRPCPQPLARKSALAAAAPGDPNDLAHWSDYARLAPHILAASPYVGDHADTRRPMLDTLAYLLFRGEVRAGRRIAEELLERWQRQLGPYHPDTITAAAAVVGALEGT